MLDLAGIDDALLQCFLACMWWTLLFAVYGSRFQLFNKTPLLWYIFPACLTTYCIVLYEFLIRPMIDCLLSTRSFAEFGYSAGNRSLSDRSSIYFGQVRKYTGCLGSPRAYNDLTTRHSGMPISCQSCSPPWKWRKKERDWNIQVVSRSRWCSSQTHYLIPVRHMSHDIPS